MYIGLMKLSRQNYTQQNHYCLSPVPFMLNWILKKYKITNHQVLFKFQHNYGRGQKNWQ